MRGCLRTSSLLLVCLLGTLPGCSRPSERPDGGVSSMQPVPGDVVAESSRQIPVLHDVDVVVVGGSSGAVSAAVAAAENGARVFLAAPRPYLGEDICGTYRLWLEPDEEPMSPLAAAVFAEPDTVGAASQHDSVHLRGGRGVGRPHRDSQPPAGLRDGKWHSAPSQSVQYNGDVNLIVDLGGEQPVGKAHLMVYQRNDEFEVAEVAFFASDDKEQWQPVATVANKRLGEGSFEETAIPLSAAIGRKARYLKLAVRKTPEAKRVLLGEIVLEGPETGGRPSGVPNAADADAGQAGPRRRPAQRGRPVPLRLLRDRAPRRTASGKLAGIVMTNRSGRQAVKAKVIIDATPRATVAENGRRTLRSLSGGHAHLQANRHRRPARRTCRERPGQAVADPRLRRRAEESTRPSNTRSNSR